MANQRDYGLTTGQETNPSGRELLDPLIKMMKPKVWQITKRCMRLYLVLECYRHSVASYEVRNHVASYVLVDDRDAQDELGWKFAEDNKFSVMIDTSNEGEQIN